jgi:hypothetical protein
MTIQIELNPEVMERLAAEAEAEGIALEEYAERLLREAIATHAEPMLAGIAEGSEKLTMVPTSAFTRESFYEDRR